MIAFTLYGEAASKANSRKLVTIADRPAFIKSAKARTFEADALRQIPPAARLRLEGPVRVMLRMFYATERPDLDETVVLDVLQDRWGKAPKGRNGERIGTRPLLQAGVYRNDRQVRQKVVVHGIDRNNPRVEVRVEALQPQQLNATFEELLEAF